MFHKTKFNKKNIKMTEFCDKDVILSGQIEFCDIHRIIKTHEKSVVK